MGVEFWKKYGLDHQTPKGLENPEGWDVRVLLAGMTMNKTVLDLGCGRGRLAPSFHPDLYTGLDPSEDCVKRARSDYPHYTFHVLDDEYPLERATSQVNVTLLYTVCLHVQDHEIGAFCARLKSDTVILAEILGRENRFQYENDDCVEPICSREKEDYMLIMEGAGYVLASETLMPYKRYEDKQISFLIFKKENG